MRHLSATMSAKNTLWMCVALAAAILAAWLVVVLGTPTKRAEAAFPGNNGKIAFGSRVNLTDQEIVTMKPNGDNKTQLTNNGLSDSPTFSPNGKMIAFASEGIGEGLDIYTMSANGTDKKNVTRSPSPDSYAAWSPDGTKIAFATSNQNNNSIDIFVINKDGTGLTRLTTSRKRDIQPAWSPDGTKIAFVRPSCLECDTSNFKIYVMKAARESQTNRPQRLTTSGSGVEESDPAWSPDGTRIAFASNQSGHVELYSIRADGSDQIRLTTTSIGLEPAWSPDGTKIAFAGKRGTDRPRSIFVMKAKPESETNRPKQLTGSRFGNFEPDWQPLP